MVDVLYIVGMARSGTTAFERFLAAHEGTVAIGEAGDRRSWRARLGSEGQCSCGALVGECRFWAGVRSRAFGSMEDAEEYALYDRIARVNRIRTVPRIRVPTIRSRRFQAELAEAQRLVERFYRAIADSAPNRLIVDATKTASYAHLLATIPELRVAFVHLVRDSRAVAYSHQHRRLNPDVDVKETHLARTSVPKAALLWDGIVAASLALLALRPRSVLQVRYEDFAADPQRTAARVQQHLGALGMRPLGPADLDAAPACYHTVLGNPLRLQSRFEVRPDHRWREDMPRKDKLLTTVMTAPFLALHSRAIGFRRYDRPDRAT